ncbi:MAG: hypothetical protein FJZ01_19450 [Candidatus Sericytochromatia bacterium]|nr:hypothetical protein [Candidatus Tanganyikabacteria bacterium]
MRTGVLWALLPDEFLILVIVFAGLGLMVGVLSRRAAMGMIGGLILMILLTPFVEDLIGGLPGWLAVIVLLVAIFLLLGGFLQLVFGRRIAEHVASNLITHAILAGLGGIARLAGALIVLPFRAIGWAIRLATRR